MSCLLFSSTSGTNSLTFCFQVLVTSFLRSEILKLRKSDMSNYKEGIREQMEEQTDRIK